MSEKFTPEETKDFSLAPSNHQFVWIAALSCWVGKYAVTNKEFRCFREAHDSGDFSGVSLNEDEQPAAMISFTDAMDYSAWLMEGSNINDDFVIRVPSHEEWTAMASCGKVKRFPWGDEWPPTYGNYGDKSAKESFPEWDHIEDYDDGFPVSCPVDKAGENEWGLVGVGGNVYEWTYEAGGTKTELRGGSWSTFQPEYLELDNRYRREASSSLINFGFRLITIKI
ncbi:MAG: SUMF1/EgtB/PvdO family nonheme iron enzyme [Lentisphaeria bacterium]|nr:SUMF1/EgtB/PvdO family nonheme iron enzyme [Lentisphaeria bacterium]